MAIKTLTGALLINAPSSTLIAGLDITLQVLVSFNLPTSNVVALNVDSTLWDGDEQAWGDADYIYSDNLPVFTIDNLFYQMEHGQFANDEPVFVSLIRTGLTIFARDQKGNPRNDPGSYKLCTGIWPMIKGPVGTVVQVYLGAQDTPESPVRWTDPKDFIVGTSYFLDLEISGRYIGVRFESLGQPVWSLSGYDLDLEIVGER